jgi:hypothetical protein
MEDHLSPSCRQACTSRPWNKGKLVGAKPPLRPSHVWSIRTKLQMQGRQRALTLFNLAIDSKLRGRDVVAIRVDDVAPCGYAMDRATIRQRKTGRPSDPKASVDRLTRRARPYVKASAPAICFALAFRFLRRQMGAQL